MRTNSRPNIVTASEIAEYVFCPEAWRLTLLGILPAPAAQAVRVEGTQHHARVAAVEVIATRSIDRGRRLVVIGLAVLALLAALWAFLR